MRKRIICSSCAAIASMLAVFCLSAYAVDAPEEDVIPCTTTVATTTSYPATSRITSTSTSATENTTTTMLTTITEVSTEVNTEIVLDDPEPIVKEERHEELWSEPVTEPIPVEPIEEYVVYKPSSYYIHRNTCHWNSDDAYRIDNTEGIEARRCSECNPDMEIINEYVVPEPEYTYTPISDSDRYYLAVMVSHECSPRASVEHNATAVACMFNRVRDGWASSIYDAIQTGCVPWWSGGSLSSYGLYGDTDYCYAAIDYYLSHSNEYSWQHSWEASGDGIHNSYS